MVNLLKEINEVLLINNKTIEDIEFICTIKKNELVEIDKTKFWLMAKYFNYDNDFGGYYIDHELKLVGKDFWLEIAEYDGSTWWEFKSKPQRPQKVIKEYMP